MRLLIVFLIVLLGLLQYKLWLGDGSIPELIKMEQRVKELKQEKQKLIKRNLVLEAEVLNLKESMDAVEGRARHDLGMIKEGETFFQVVE